MAIRNHPTVRIEGYTPEEYAAQWGCDPAYDHAPNHKGDGYLFYNFSSEHQRRDRVYLNRFVGAILRTITAVRMRPEVYQPGDVGSLEKLLAHVRSLRPE